MRLNEKSKIWDNDISSLKITYRKYRRLSIISWLVEILAWIGFILLLIINNASAPSFFLSLLLISLVFIFGVDKYISRYSSPAYRFYKKHKTDIIEEEYFDLSTQRLYTILYCTGCKRVKEGKKADYYLDLIVSLCNENEYQAARIMKFMLKYRCDESDSNTCVEIIRGARNKAYLVEIKETNIADEEKEEVGPKKEG